MTRARSSSSWASRRKRSRADPLSDTEREQGQALARVAELQDKIQQASQLIRELREKNYSMTAELAELRRELKSPSKNESDDGGGGAPQAELDALRKERKTIRKKVALLLERIEKIES